MSLVVMSKKMSQKLLLACSLDRILLVVLVLNTKLLLAKKSKSQLLHKVTTQSFQKIKPLI
jgi:hypothetical protein